MPATPNYSLSIFLMMIPTIIGKPCVSPYCRFHFSLILILANPVQQDSYGWEPFIPNEPVPSVPSTSIEETDSSNDDFFEPYQPPDLGLQSLSSYTGNVCARDGRGATNGAMCYLEPQCDGGRSAMCCGRVNEYGRPTDCTRCVSIYLDNSHSGNH